MYVFIAGESFTLLRHFDLADKPISVLIQSLNGANSYTDFTDFF